MLNRTSEKRETDSVPATRAHACVYTRKRPQKASTDDNFYLLIIDIDLWPKFISHMLFLIFS